ncbi:radical SAM protein [Nocardiopsis ansamitocini]|uniref:Radical SAM protein n=1 Tax=Nocardiopsis ansamitocini TaxID=1670832 RepID=A0A9W6PAB3_9ACTN|nr:radical SAM protein [Nocardiopsis ansamitocini]GLU50534.1 hypothetical protein Nans01_48850 [Nocardiopsis ansamitocini]
MTARPPRFLALDITRKCQLSCGHCYNRSGPGLGHGEMLTVDWMVVLDQAADLGVHTVQFIGGEPTSHPGFRSLVRYAVDQGLHVEVYSNLVHVASELWPLYGCGRVSLATSYYSPDPREHAAITGRPAVHSRTRANIAEAVRRDIPIRVGLVNVLPGQKTEQARAELVSLGVPEKKIRTDRVRAFGRAAQPPADGPALGELCGRCGDSAAAVLPSGDVVPCVMAAWMTAGNVRERGLHDILAGPRMAGHRAAIAGRNAPRTGWCAPDDSCPPQDSNDCDPQNQPADYCDPDLP